MQKIEAALWQIYRRAERPLPWQILDGNLPWDDPDFSERMLREHLDESHGAASRQRAEREKLIEWIWQKFNLQAGHQLLDVACGPGLYAVEFAKRGCQVVGVDFAPAALAYAQELAVGYDVSDRCRFIKQDMRQMQFAENSFEAALLLYGQLAVMTKAEALAVLTHICQALKPGGMFCLELLDQELIDKKKSSWWFTDDTGLWGEAPFLHLGERFWLADEEISIERFHILHLQTGDMDVIELCDQTYAEATVVEMLKQAGFTAVAAYPAWDNTNLYDEHEWIGYVATK